MNTIIQTVDIKPNRHVSLNFALPEDFPLGMANVSITIQPSIPDNQHFGLDTSVQKTVDGTDLTEEMIQRRRECLRTRCFVSRREWGQYADNEIRLARDNDRI